MPMLRNFDVRDQDVPMPVSPPGHWTPSEIAARARVLALLAPLIKTAHTTSLARGDAVAVLHPDVPYMIIQPWRIIQNTVRISGAHDHTHNRCGVEMRMHARRDNGAPTEYHLAYATDGDRATMRYVMRDGDTDPTEANGRDWTQHIEWPEQRCGALVAALRTLENETTARTEAAARRERDACRDAVIRKEHNVGTLAALGLHDAPQRADSGRTE